MMNVMDTNILGLIVSFAFLGLVVLVGAVLHRYTTLSSEFIRKFIHICVSNWWFILLAWMNNVWFAIVGPIFFIIANAALTFGNFGGFLGMTDKRRNYGLIYYPASLLIFVILVYNGKLLVPAATIGVLSMGYGDGLAAIVGKTWGKKRLPWLSGGKTWLGTCVMMLVSAVIAYIFLPLDGTWYRLLAALLCGVVSAFLEAVTPLGLDNLTVPFGVAFWVVMLC